MQQRQLRLGDILDDYCPRERRVTNHAVVAMVGDEVKQTRCTTCDAEHVYKQARIPRQRRKDEAPAALYAQVAAGAPKRVSPPRTPVARTTRSRDAATRRGTTSRPLRGRTSRCRCGRHSSRRPEPLRSMPTRTGRTGTMRARTTGPVHRPLIRASLPRPDGQQPPSRPIPEFTIRQPGGGRPNRFRPRHHRGGPGGGQGHQGHQGHQFHGNTGNRRQRRRPDAHGSRPNAGRPGG